jgi:transposase InsO family protein
MCPCKQRIADRADNLYILTALLVLWGSQGHAKRIAFQSPLPSTVWQVTDSTQLSTIGLSLRL